jgi:hypothetical protein
VIHYHDGEKVTLSSDRAQLREEVEKWEGPGGGDQLDAFLAYVFLLFYFTIFSRMRRGLIVQGRITTRFTVLFTSFEQGISYIPIFTPTDISEEFLQTPCPG